MTFWGIRERERDWERDLQARGERAGGGWRSKRKGVFKANARGCTSDDQMMMISIVLFKKQTELGSIYLEEGTYLGDTRQETHYEDIYTALKRPFFYPELPFPILPCASHLPPLFCQSWSLALSLLSAIARAPLKLCCLSMTSALPRLSWRRQWGTARGWRRRAASSESAKIPAKIPHGGLALDPRATAEGRGRRVRPNCHQYQ